MNWYCQMQREFKLPVFATLICLSPLVNAQIVTDGTVGPSVTFNGGQIEITDTLGQRNGSNLFHSFSQFSVQDGNSVLFTGAADIENVISRVTGGDQSVIDGDLVSEVSNANFYFINPAGIVIGQNASIDVPAAFYSSTASQILHDDGTVYSAVNPNTGVLSIAVPEAFGFLGGEANLELGAARLDDFAIGGADVGFVAPNIDIEGLRPSFAFELSVNGNSALVATGNYQGAVAFDSMKDQWQSFNGNISGVNLIIEGAGGDADITLLGGEIALSSGTIVRGFDGASIFVRAQDIDLTNGSLVASLERESDATPSDPTDGGVDVIATSINLTDGARINSTTRSSVNARSVSVQALGDININGGGSGITGIQSEAGPGSTGDAGDIVVTVGGDLQISQAGNIRSQAFASGKGGDVEITAVDIHIDGSTVEPDVSAIRLETGISASSEGSGAAGTINVGADNITILDSGIIGASDNSGQASAGAVTVVAAQSLVADGVDTNSPFKTGIVSDSSNPLQPGGNVVIDVEDGSILVTNGARISAVSASESDPGKVAITANNLTLSSQGTVSGEAFNVGDGGEVTVRVGNLLQLQGDAVVPPMTGVTTGITTKAENGGAGPISIDAGRIVIDNALITTTTNSTSENGGSIDIDGGPLIMKSALIQANANSGQGGEISIDSSTLVSSQNRLLSDTVDRVEFRPNGPSVIQAVAPDGVTIEPVISAPQIDISGAISDLDPDLLDESGVVANPCANVSDARLSTLIEVGRGGLPATVVGSAGNSGAEVWLVELSADDAEKWHDSGYDNSSSGCQMNNG